MSTNTKTLKVAEFLLDHPQVTAYIFEQNAQGVSTAILHEKVQPFADIQSSDAPEFTNHMCRKVLHREKPFNHPQIYSCVNPDTEAAVQLRFHKNVKRRSTNGTARPSSFTEKLSIANEVFEARAAYERAIHKAKQIGMDESSLDALADIVYEQCRSAA